MSSSSIILHGWKLALILPVFMVADTFAQPQQKQLFTINEFIEQVKKYHPVARQADIQVDKANAELLSARGNFDPAVYFDASRKTFDGKNYYFYTNPELNIPLPVGNIKTGFENNGGDLITPEITKGQTSYLGIELPLARGLLLDKRRAMLQQAKILRSQSQQERLLMRNNLIFESCIAYWQWAGACNLYDIFTKFADIAEGRLRLIRIAFSNGDRAAMDTVEAFSQLQNYQLLQNEALLRRNLATLELSNYLWRDNENNYELPSTIVPESLEPAANKRNNDVEELIAISNQKNPALRIYDFKINSLNVERRLKQQNLLPYFSIKANLLNRDYYVLRNMSGNLLENNYKWGVDFKIPLFLRQARGDYRQTILKLTDARLDLQNKRVQTENKIRSYFNELIMLQQQLTTVQHMIGNYQVLLRNEELKFSQGESAMFLLNSRENKLVEAMQKRVELTLKYLKAKYAVLWSAGVLE